MLQCCEAASVGRGLKSPTLPHSSLGYFTSRRLQQGVEAPDLAGKEMGARIVPTGFPPNLLANLPAPSEA